MAPKKFYPDRAETVVGPRSPPPPASLTAMAPTGLSIGGVSSRICCTGKGEISNRILRALPADVCQQVLHKCHHVEFPPGHVIYRAGAAAENAYFVNAGIVSLVKSMGDGRSVEVGAVGRDGLIGVFAASGLDHSLAADYVVQLPLAALRVNRIVLQRAMSQHDALRSAIMKYLFLLAEQLAQISACNRLHSLEQRCCHWLLIAHDSVSADEFPLTHEFYAALLGVQRPSLSVTAHDLQSRGLICYRHGRITILDRTALEDAACECYGTLRRQIDKLFDPAHSDREPVKTAP